MTKKNFKKEFQKRLIETESFYKEMAEESAIEFMENINIIDSKLKAEKLENEILRVSLSSCEKVLIEKDTIIRYLETKVL